MALLAIGNKIKKMWKEDERRKNGKERKVKTLSKKLDKRFVSKLVISKILLSIKIVCRIFLSFRIVFSFYSQERERE